VKLWRNFISVISSWSSLERLVTAHDGEQKEKWDVKCTKQVKVALFGNPV